MLETKIIDLKKEIVTFASHIQEMITKNLKALINKDKELIKEIIEKDEPKANSFEIEIDEMGTNLIAQFAPKGRDLRTILMILKMNKDLERVGDHEVNIAQSIGYLIDRPLVKPLIDIPRMYETVIVMFKDAITAFVDGNDALAKDVCQRDSVVDEMKNQILNELISIMTKDSSSIERSLHLLRISSNLERIADISTNICEEVIYMVKGQDIKHHQ